MVMTTLMALKASNLLFSYILHSFHREGKIAKVDKILFSGLEGDDLLKTDSVLY